MLLRFGDKTRQSSEMQGCSRGMLCFPPQSSGVVVAAVYSLIAALLNLLQVFARNLTRWDVVCRCALRHLSMRLVLCSEMFFAIFVVVMWALISAWGSLPNLRTRPLRRICKECWGAPLLWPALRGELVHGRDPNMAFLREQRIRLSPFPAARSLSLNSPASMLAKVSFEHEGRREMVFFAISFFPAAMFRESFFFRLM